MHALTWVDGGNTNKPEKSIEKKATADNRAVCTVNSRQF